MTFGEKLQLLRKQKGLSQEQLAEQLNISRQAISKWESNTSLPDMTNVVLLSKIFNVSTDYFFKDDVEDEEPDISENGEKDSRKQIIICVVAATAIVIAFIICFVQNAHMKEELKRLEEQVAGLSSSIIWDNDSGEQESLLTSFEVSYISDEKEDMHSGTATYLCSVVPKEFTPEETSVVLIYNGKECPMTFENGKYIAELTVPFYESSEITEVQLRENGIVRTEAKGQSLQPSVSLPLVTGRFNGKALKQTKDDKVLWKHKGEFEVRLAGLAQPIKSIEMITCIDGKEQKRAEIPQNNLPQMQWDTDSEIPNEELFYYAIGETFEIPLGSTFDLYMEFVDEYGMRYCKRIRHAHFDEEGKFVDNYWPEEELEGIYNKDGKRMSDI